MFKKILLILTSLAGLTDASYLAFEHFSNYIPPCSTNIFFADCGKVLNSPYAIFAGIPLAVMGMIHYGFIIFLGICILLFQNKLAKYLLVLETTAGFLMSLYLVFLQLVIIQAICLYCMFSALISTLLFLLILTILKTERKRMTLSVMHFLYIYAAKPIFFLINPETVHVHIVWLGENIAGKPMAQSFTKFLIHKKEPALKQHIAGIPFDFPVGLAAGFDYEARLTQTLFPWGFGFQSVGTITNNAYGGNPKPMLGRLPKSKSLMVNKGFKNLGADATIARLTDLSFEIPVGISIGKTNSLHIKTQKEAIKDIITAFKKFEKTNGDHAYYELNISCPNLLGDISFYPPRNLDELLSEIDKLKLTRPLFIKMPIEKNDKEVLDMLKIITKHTPAGVIFGNLQKDKTNKALVKSEVAKFDRGYFSGKPTFERSNELIALTYKHYGKKLIIIGCGGIFSPEDAYKKITLGASLVQMITGMIYEGPNLIMEINFGLCDLLEKDGFTHLSEAIGSKNKH